MSGHETKMTNELDRVNGLLAWWGLPNTGDTIGIQARARRLQVLMVNLTSVLSDASSNQARAAVEANDRFHKAVRDFLNAREAPEILAAQSGLVRGLMENLTIQVQACTELTQKLRACCAEATRPTDDGANTAAESAAAGDKPGRVDPASAGKRHRPN